jgi:hypothetical protein
LTIATTSRRHQSFSCRYHPSLLCNSSSSVSPSLYPSRCLNQVTDVSDPIPDKSAIVATSYFQVPLLTPSARSIRQVSIISAYSRPWFGSGRSLAVSSMAYSKFLKSSTLTGSGTGESIYHTSAENEIQTPIPLSSRSKESMIRKQPRKCSTISHSRARQLGYPRCRATSIVCEGFLKFLRKQLTLS